MMGSGLAKLSPLLQSYSGQMRYKIALRSPIAFMLCIFFFQWPHLRHMEVPRPGVKSEMWLQPMPQLQLQWIPQSLHRARD